MPPFTAEPEKSFLASYRPARPAFAPCASLPPALVAIWKSLGSGHTRAALEAGLGALRDGSVTGPYHAPLLAAVAYAYAQQGSPARARQLAQASLDALPDQWLARRVLLDAALAEQAYAEALSVAAGFAPVHPVAPWDEPLTPEEQHLTAAACAWLAGAWPEAARHLRRAYPGGVRTMPAALREDWFRLAFHHEAPDDAADAAGVLIEDCATDEADVLLQTLVKQGWHRHALPLYRTLYDRNPGSELLRRRLVGLCIRAGDVDGARKLMERGALTLSKA